MLTMHVSNFSSDSVTGFLQHGAVIECGWGSYSWSIYLFCWLDIINGGYYLEESGGRIW